MIMNEEEVRVLILMVMTYIKVLSWQLSGQTEENHHKTTAMIAVYSTGLPTLHYKSLCVMNSTQSLGI
jgi:hypothetical protein